MSCDQSVFVPASQGEMSFDTSRMRAHTKSLLWGAQSKAPGCRAEHRGPSEDKYHPTLGQPPGGRGEGSPFSWQTCGCYPDNPQHHGLLLSLQQEWKTHTLIETRQMVRVSDAGRCETQGLKTDGEEPGGGGRCVPPESGSTFPRWQLIWNAGPTLAELPISEGCLTSSVCLFLAVLGLRCAACFSLVVASRGLLFVVVCRFLIVVASFVAEHGLKGVRASVVVTP